jgi:phage baseplate assembly protein W
MSTLSLSDKNVTQEKASVVSKRRQYSDLDLSLRLLSSKDIVPLTDIDAIKNSIRNILLSNRYDRPFQPDLGAGLRDLLFEPADTFTRFAIKQNIEHALKKYEPRVNQVKVNVAYEEGEDRYNVNLTFNIISIATKTDMRLLLNRIR